MHFARRKLTPKSSFTKLAAILAFLAAAFFVTSLSFGAKAGFQFQQAFPDPPSDATRVYYLAENKLLPLPFEQATNTVDVFHPAPQDKIVRLRITGRTAETVVTSNSPSFYVFIADRMDPPPHLLVRLASRDSRRELAISMTKGRKGYGSFESDTVRLERRLLDRLEMETGKNRILFVNYMQLRPVGSLAPGEYAIIGDSLADIATFRVQ
jgi:hypothetical protein